MKHRELDHIELLCLEIKEYNKKNATHYSYGEYTALVRAGKIVSDVMNGKVCRKDEN
jgi:hypothetical protein